MAFDGNDRKVLENFRAGMRLDAKETAAIIKATRGTVGVPEPNREDQMRALTSAYMADRLTSIEYAIQMEAL